MIPCIKGIAVQPMQEYKLLLTFSTAEKKIFDCTPWLHKGLFSELKDPALFQKVSLSFDTIEWENTADLDPEFLYSASKTIL